MLFVAVLTDIIIYLYIPLLPVDVPASAITTLAKLDSTQSSAADGQVDKQSGSSKLSSHASKGTSPGKKGICVTFLIIL